MDHDAAFVSRAVQCAACGVTYIIPPGMENAPCSDCRRTAAQAAAYREARAEQLRRSRAMAFGFRGRSMPPDPGPPPFPI